MICSPVMALRQVGAEQANYWMAFPMSSSTLMDAVSSPKAIGADTSASVDDALVKVRKPYTITKQRERWTEDEHQKFLDALKLHGRAWRRIEEHIGTKTAVQIRSHAQKFFSKVWKFLYACCRINDFLAIRRGCFPFSVLCVHLFSKLWAFSWSLEREASLGGSLATAGSGEIEIPPPRPKRKPSHPYPKKACGALSNSPSFEDDCKSPPAVYSAFTPLESSETTKSSSLPKKAAFSSASLRLFGQTMVQGMDKVESDNDFVESTGSPRSQLSIGTEETSVISPMVSNTASATWDRSFLTPKLNEPAIIDTNSQLFNAITEWEKSLFALHAPHAIGGHHLSHHIPAFWQGFVPPSFANGTNEDTTTAAAIAAATYVVASAWQAIQGAHITNASNDSNTSLVYSPIAIPAAAGKPLSVSRPNSPPHEHQKTERGGHHGERASERGNDSEETDLHGEESTAECCSSLTDSSRLSSYESNDERALAKKRQRKFFDNHMPLHHESSEALQSMKCERVLKVDRSSSSENSDNLQKSTAIQSRSTNGYVDGSSEIDNTGQSLSDELMQPVEDNLQTSVSMDAEQPLHLIIQACGLGVPAKTDVQKENYDWDKEILSSLSTCDEANKSCILKECVEGFSANKEQKDVDGIPSDMNHTHTECGEHLFMIKTGASLSSRYSGEGFVPYRKSTTSHSPR